MTTTPKTTTDSLARAIERLNAVEVAPGKYAYRDDATRCYYVVDAEDLKALGTTDDYSRWCADTEAIEMPSWWTPEQRFAVSKYGSGERRKFWDDGIVATAWSVEQCRAHIRVCGGKRIVTADLTTGEEIPA